MHLRGTVAPPLTTSPQNKFTCTRTTTTTAAAKQVKAYDEEVHALALHPSGHALLAAFADRLRLLTVLADDLGVQRELPLKVRARGRSGGSGGGGRWGGPALGSAAAAPAIARIC